MIEDEGAATSTSWRWGINNSGTQWMKRYTPTGTLQHAFRLNSFLSNGLRITFDTINDAQPYVYNYLVMWGTDIEVNSTTWNAPLVAGAQVIPHGLSGAPNMQLYLAGAISADNGSLAPAHLMLGMASGTAAANQASLAIDVRNAQATMDTYRYMPAGNAIGILTPTSGVINALANISAIDATNVTVDWTDPPSAGWRMSALFIKGGNHNVHTILAPSTPGNVTKTALTFQPEGLFSFSRGLAASTTADAHASITVGALNTPAPDSSPLANFALYRPPANTATQNAIDAAYAPYIRPTDWIGAYNTGASGGFEEAKAFADTHGCKLWIGKPMLATYTPAAFPGVTWCVYDLEACATTNPDYPCWPANSTISQNEMAAQAQIAHDKGLFFCANLGDPTNDPVNIEVMCANPNVDAVHIQVMGQQSTSQTQFVNWCKPRIEAARRGFVTQGHPEKPVFIGPSVSFRGTNDEVREPTYVLGHINAVMAVAPYDGVHFFYGSLTGTDVQHIPRLAEMMQLLFDGDTATYRAASFVSEDATASSNSEGAVRSTDRYVMASPSTAVDPTVALTAIPVMQDKLSSFTSDGYVLTFDNTVSGAVNAVWAFAANASAGIPYNRAISEPSILVADSVGKRLAAKRAPSTETITVAGGTLGRVKAVQRAPALETVTVGGTVAKASGKGRTITEIPTQISDSLQRVPGSNPGIDEQPVAVADAVTAQVNYSRTLATETVDVTDDPITRQLAAQRAPPVETVSVMTENEFNLQEFNPAEFGVEGGFVTARFGIGRSLPTEVVIVGDSIFVASDASAFFTDIPTETVEVSDSVVRLLEAMPAIIETTEVSDSVERLAARLVTLATETVDVTDDPISRVLAANRAPPTEITNVSESIQQGAAANPNISEQPIPVSDSVSRTVSLNVGITETTAVSDTPTRLLAAARSPPAESVTVGSGIISNLMGAGRTIDETVPVADQIGKVFGAKRAITETTAISEDAIVSLYDAQREIDEEVPIADLVQENTSTPGQAEPPTENTAVTGTVTAVMDALRSIVTDEIVPVSDSITAAKGITSTNSKRVRGFTAGRRAGGTTIARRTRGTMPDMEEKGQQP